MFITLEGIEGSGKSTLSKLLVPKLEELGHKVLLTREPGDSSIGGAIRKLLLNPETKLEPQSEVLLFLADRAQHIQEIIIPALKAKKIVICDRFTDSTMAYQGYGRGLDLKLLELMNKFACQNISPDLTFLLDLPARTGLERANKRNQQDSLEQEARFEQESLEFHEKIRQAFLSLAKQEAERFYTLDASKKSTEMLNECIGLIKAYL